MPTPMTPMEISTHDKHTPTGMNTHTHDGGCTPTVGVGVGQLSDTHGYTHTIPYC